MVRGSVWTRPLRLKRVDLHRLFISWQPSILRASAFTPNWINEWRPRWKQSQLCLFPISWHNSDPNFDRKINPICLKSMSQKLVSWKKSSKLNFVQQPSNRIYWSIKKLSYCLSYIEAKFLTFSLAFLLLEVGKLFVHPVRGSPTSLLFSLDWYLASGFEETCRLWPDCKLW